MLQIQMVEQLVNSIWLCVAIASSEQMKPAAC